MLFDPFEEQFDLPATAIKLGDGQCRQVEIVGQKDQIFLVFGIVELDAAQVLRVIVACLGRGQGNRLVAAQASGFVHGARVNTAKLQIGFAANDKERLRLVQGEPAGEVGEAAIHDVKAASFGYQDVEYIDFVHLAVADVNESWNVAAQVEQRMHFDCGFCLTKARPGEDAQAQVDGRGIERVDRLFQLHRKAVAGVKRSGGLNQAHREIRKDAAVALLVGIGQCAFGNIATDA